MNALPEEVGRDGEVGNWGIGLLVESLQSLDETVEELPENK